jgi:hypothetical protein
MLKDATPFCVNLSPMQIPISGITLHSIQFAAILGDLSHKTGCYLQLQDFSTNTTCLFANVEQAHWISSRHPALIPPGDWNTHSLGTFFEYFYYTNLTFRLDYIVSLPSLTCSLRYV